MSAFNDPETVDEDPPVTGGISAALLMNVPPNACLGEESCDWQRDRMGLPHFQVTDHNMKGCFYKGDVAYFGTGGTVEEMSTPSEGKNIRIWCDGGKGVSSGVASARPTSSPTPGPTTSSPTPGPTLDVAEETCFTSRTYAAIDDDIAAMKNRITDARARTHLVGGIVRLVAHDFMDYDRNRPDDPMGPDGCFDPDHVANGGLPQGIWCRDGTCPLADLYDRKYSHLSRADFWVASANAVIRQASVGNALDMRDDFLWGRADADSCPGSGDRLPSPAGCGEVEHVFLRNMGLDWRDAVALLGAHTLGRADRNHTGHHGMWVDTDEDAQRFDKQYYEEIYLNIWRPNNHGTASQDWTTGRPDDGDDERVFLNTDMCLVYDVDDVAASKCCSRTGFRHPDGTDLCVDGEAARRQCPFRSRMDGRREAAEAVFEMLGGPYPNDNNEPFYEAFREAWGRATAVGRTDLLPLAESCELL